MIEEQVGNLLKSARLLRSKCPLARAELNDLPASQKRRSTPDSKDDRERAFDSGGAHNKFCFLRTGAELEGQIWMDALAS